MVRNTLLLTMPLIAGATTFAGCGGNGLDNATDLQAFEIWSAHLIENPELDVRLKDPQQWFGEHFEPELARKLAEEYVARTKDRGGLARVLAKAKAAGRTELRVRRVSEPIDLQGTGLQNMALERMTRPTPLYTLQMVKPGEDSGLLLWSFAKVDGEFRFVGLMTALKPARTDQVTSILCIMPLGKAEEMLRERGLLATSAVEHLAAKGLLKASGEQLSQRPEPESPADPQPSKPLSPKSGPAGFDAYDFVSDKVRPHLHPLQKELLDKLNEYAARRKELVNTKFRNSILKKRAEAEFAKQRREWEVDWRKRVASQGLENWAFTYDDKRAQLGFARVPSDLTYGTTKLVSVSINIFDTNGPQGSALLGVRDGDLVFVTMPVDQAWATPRYTPQWLGVVHDSQDARLRVQGAPLSPQPDKKTAKPVASLEPIFAQFKKKKWNLHHEQYRDRILEYLTQPEGRVNHWEYRDPQVRAKAVTADLVARRPHKWAWPHAREADDFRKQVETFNAKFDWGFPLKDPRVMFRVASHLAAAVGKADQYAAKMKPFQPKTVYEDYRDKFSIIDYGFPFFAQTRKYLPHLIEYDAMRGVYLVRSEVLARVRGIHEDFSQRKSGIGKAGNAAAERERRRLRGFRDDVIVQMVDFWGKTLAQIDAGLKRGDIIEFQEPGFKLPEDSH